jgi:uncharacterized protein (TIGR00266 family)
MQFNIVGDRDPLLHVKLLKGERVHAESNAMVSMDATLDLTSKMQGGVVKALTRKLVNGESFFNQEVVATRGDGEVLFAPMLPGDIEVLEVGEVQYFLNDGAFLASEAGVEVGVKTQGLAQGLFGGTGGFFVMKTAGSGKIAVSGFGSIFALPVKPGSDLTIDNQHVLAWDSRLEYSVSMRTSQSGGLLASMVNSVTSAEGLVTRFSGEGKVYLSSRNIASFISHVATRVPR